MTTYQIAFEPVGKRGRCSGNMSFLQYARETGIGINSVCGGKGTCKSCKMRVISGSVSDPVPVEVDLFTDIELAQGWRLACQTFPRGDCIVHIPPESMTTSQRTQVEGVEETINPEPAVAGYVLDMTALALTDLQADSDRIVQSLDQQHNVRCTGIDIEVIRNLSPKVRSLDWHCQVIVRTDELIAVNAIPGGLFGLAFDVGTTKIAGYLVDLQSGRAIDSKGIMNPQISYGEDVISRIEYAIKSPADSRELQDTVVQALNGLTSDLCSEMQINIDAISDVVIVGNTVMHHLFLGLPVAQLSRNPFVPAVAQALDVKCRDAGLHAAPGAYIHFLPNIAGYVGSDHVAVLLTVPDQADNEGAVLVIDIGTNTEISLIDKGEIYAVSCASGPAFEGSHLAHGMRAADGAIERIALDEGTVRYQTVGGIAPIGICGSAALDVLAQLHNVGLIDASGKMGDDHLRMRTSGRHREFVIVSEQERDGQAAITLTQKDVRELQLAKGAIRTGIEVLVRAAGISGDQIQRVIIAGAFGTYIDVSSAITIGLLPSLPLGRFLQVGNAAGAGAKRALLSKPERRRAIGIASRVKYIELATAPDFKDIFMQATYLGRYRV